MSGFAVDLLARFQRGIVDALFGCSNSGARGHIKITKTDILTQGETPERNSSARKPSFFLHNSGCFDGNLPKLLVSGKNTSCKGPECSDGNYNDEQLIHGVDPFLLSPGTVRTRKSPSLTPD